MPPVNLPPKSIEATSRPSPSQNQASGSTQSTPSSGLVIPPNHAIQVPGGTSPESLRVQASGPLSDLPLNPRRDAHASPSRLSLRNAIKQMDQSVLDKALESGARIEADELFEW